jgi:excisionase family DNA binding protein
MKGSINRMFLAFVTECFLEVAEVQRRFPWLEIVTALALLSESRKLGSACAESAGNTENLTTYIFFGLLGEYSENEMDRQTGSLLRVNNVARRCGVSCRTIRSWADSGLLPATKRGPKLWFFKESDVNDFLDSTAGKEITVVKNGRATATLFHYQDCKTWPHIHCILAQVTINTPASFSSTSVTSVPSKRKDFWITASVDVEGSLISEGDADELCFCMIARGLVLLWSELGLSGSTIDFVSHREIPCLAQIEFGYSKLWRGRFNFPFEIGNFIISSSADKQTFPLGLGITESLVEHWKGKRTLSTTFASNVGAVYGYHMRVSDVVRIPETGKILLDLLTGR